MKCVLGMLAMVLALGGSWVAAEEIGPVSAPLEPMAEPVRHIGDSKTWRNKKGEETTSTVVAMDETTLTVEDSDGCTYTKLIQGGFSPSVKWSNCGGSDGTQTVSLAKGDVWPLTTRKKWRYKYKGKNEKGERWKGKWSCQVKEEVRVSVPAGEFDTYHVVCKHGNWRRDYYVSPEFKSSVMYKRTHRYGKPGTTEKLVSIDSRESG